MTFDFQSTASHVHVKIKYWVKIKVKDKAVQKLRPYGDIEMCLLLLLLLL